MDSFCEEDYAVTRYVAEFVNTLTNLVYGMSAPSSVNDRTSSESTMVLEFDAAWR